MSYDQQILIANYKSLREQIGIEALQQMASHSISLLLEFCDLFKTDDLKLFKMFLKLQEKQNCLNTSIHTDDLINLYAIRYELDPEKDIEKIMFHFVNNRINHGSCYHLNSSANFESIMELGLGLSAIGMKTEERQDYEKLQSMIPYEIWCQLQPFNGEKEQVAYYYSATPRLSASYGKKPEWLRKMQENIEVINGSPEIQNAICQILQKYDMKYNNKDRMLFILPYPEIYGEERISSLLNNYTPTELIYLLYGKINSSASTDCKSKTHTPGNSILALDLTTLNLYYQTQYGIESIDDYSKENQQKR